RYILGTGSKPYAPSERHVSGQERADRIHSGRRSFTMNPDGSEIKQLTHLGPDNSATFPAWSADGKQIVFNESPPPDGIPQLGDHERRRQRPAPGVRRIRLFGT